MPSVRTWALILLALGTEFEVARAGGCNTMVPLAVPEALATV